MAVSMRKQIAQNKRNTYFVMFVFVAFIALVGYLISRFTLRYEIFVWCTVAALAYALIQYFLADKIALAGSGARRVEKSDGARYYNAVAKLAEDAKIPMPKTYIIQDSAPNAFATGRDPEHSSVAVTTGLLEIMNDKELKAVLAHELSHIKNFDIRVSMIVFGLASIVGLISDFGLRILFYSDRDEEENSPVGMLIMILTLLVSPIVSTMIQLSISRQREYLADASAASLLGEPDDMINALRKLDQHSRPMRQQNVASDALYISSPLKKSAISRLFSTHPSIESRIERLENAKK